jgi:HEAT repeat protein
VLSATGCGTPADDDGAVKWYRLAAEGWHEDAQRNLGYMYYAGRGVTRDIVQAVKWFRRASARGRAVGLTLMGFTFAGGRERERGLPQDDVLAYFFWSAAKAQGDAAMQRALDDIRRRMSPEQVAEAGRLLAAWQETPDRTLEDWVSLLGAPYSGDSDEAQKRVRDAGAEAVPALAAALRTAGHGPHLMELCEEVRRIGPAAREAAPALEALLASRPAEDAYRPFAASALARIDPARGKAHVAELERCSLGSKRWRPWVRLGCLFALDDVESPSVPVRIALLADEDADLRAMAARGLGKAPAAQVRVPLEKAVHDPVLDVRVRAASSLITAAPDASAAARPPLLEGLCTGTGLDASLVADTLAEVPPEVGQKAAGTLAGYLSDPKCQTWAAVALGRLDAPRTVPVLGLLRKALASDDEWLRRSAGWTLGSMGPLAREALADLEEAARKDPDLAFSRDRLKAPPPGLEGLRLQEVRLVALGKREGASVAYLMHDTGSVWEVRAGQRLFDGAVERVDALGLDFVAGEASARPGRTRLTLFAGAAPAPHGLDPKQYNGTPLSIDLEADVTTFAMMIGPFSGLNLALEAGTRGPVRIAARDAPWDGVLERALHGGGFRARIDRSIVRIGREDRMGAMRPLSSGPWSGQPISISVRNADMRDIARLFAHISGLTVDLSPPEPYEPVTIVVQDVPWDEAFDLIMASHGWSYRKDGDRLRVEVPGAGR